MDNMDYFTNRRTIRKYSEKHVSEELLLKMIGQASHVPTTGNMQLYSVVTTRTLEGKQALSPAHFNQPSVINCDVVLTFCADFNRFIHWCEVSDAVPGYDNFQSFMMAVLDTTLFAQQFCTIAEMNGLGCCYLGTTTYNAPQIAQVLKLPKYVVPVTTLTLGYPDGESPTSDRLPITAIIHSEQYHDYSDEDIKNIYTEKEARDDSQQYVIENEKQSLAQVFTDVRYTKADSDVFSKIYYDFIIKQGYKFP